MIPALRSGMKNALSRVRDTSIYALKIVSPKISRTRKITTKI
jgi:hypothetical protein